MELNKRLIDGLLLFAIIVALFAGTWVKRSSVIGKPSGCHMAAAAQDPGQDPGEEEGNPTHKRPERNCSHTPSSQQVDCHCKVDCNPDGTQKEDRRCRSYCYKDKCSCPRKPCE